MHIDRRSPSPRQSHPVLKAAAGLTLTVLVAGCASTAATPTPTTGTSSVAPASAPAKSADASAAAGGATRPIEGGTLEPGVTYVSEELNLSLEPTEDDWYALEATDGEFELTRERIAVWFTRPFSIRPDGTATSSIDPPTEAAAFVELVEAHPAVTVIGTEPFLAGGLEGVMVDLESEGMAEGSALLTTGDGDAFGFPDGEGRILLFPNDDGLVMISIEGGESRDAAWDIVGPLLESMDTAP